VSPEIMFPPGIAYINGDYCPISEAKISVLDWGFLHSDATYDVVHVWKGRFFRLDAHIERFLNGIENLRMKLPFGPERLVEILGECVGRSGLEDAYVEMVLTRGISPTFSRDPRDAIPTFIAFAIPFGWVANDQQRERGLDLHISDINRIDPASVNPAIKNYHWLDLIAGLYEAYDAGRESVVLVDRDGNLAEGPGFNVFALTGSTLRTPGSGVLQGITRRTVMELAGELGLSVETCALSPDNLRQADEVLITSTAGGIMPVCKIDGKPVGGGVPGPVTGRLSDLYWQKHSDPAWSSPVSGGT
jgi:branched-chain amino acid aminotransferase